MGKKKAFSQGKSEKLKLSENDYGIVGVIGSIPIASTNFKQSKKFEIVEIQGSWELVPAAKMVNGMPFLFRVLRPKSTKKFEKSLNAKKRSKVSA